MEPGQMNRQSHYETMAKLPEWKARIDELTKQRVSIAYKLSDCESIINSYQEEKEKLEYIITYIDDVRCKLTDVSFKLWESHQCLKEGFTIDGVCPASEKINKRRELMFNKNLECIYKCKALNERISELNKLIISEQTTLDGYTNKMIVLNQELTSLTDLYLRYGGKF